MDLSGKKTLSPTTTPPNKASSHGGIPMGLVYAELELTSSDDLALYRRGLLSDNQIKRVNVNALVDSGAYMLVINEQIRKQLELPVLGDRLVRLADDSEVRVDVVGPIEVRFENRSTTTRALVFPGSAEPLLGVIPMKDLDVMIDPRQQRLIVNPDNPNIAGTYVKHNLIHTVQV